MADEVYSTIVVNGIYNLARNYYISGFLGESERLCEGLLVTAPSLSAARMMLASIHFEKGNYSLAANHFRVAVQDKQTTTSAKVGILASYCGLKDYARAASLAQELEPEIARSDENLKSLYLLYRETINKAVRS